jgi:hypothetical protein
MPSSPGSPSRRLPGRTGSCCCHISRGSGPPTGRTPRGPSTGCDWARRPRPTWPAPRWRGLLCGLADGLDALLDQGAKAERVLLVGGGARSQAVRELAPSAFGCPVLVPAPAENVADGAARQAAWVLSGEDAPPMWERDKTETYVADPVPSVRLRYAQVRDQSAPRGGHGARPQPAASWWRGRRTARRTTSHGTDGECVGRGDRQQEHQQRRGQAGGGRVEQRSQRVDTGRGAEELAIAGQCQGGREGRRVGARVGLAVRRGQHHPGDRRKNSRPASHATTPKSTSVLRGRRLARGGELPSGRTRTAPPARVTRRPAPPSPWSRLLLMQQGRDHPKGEF